MAQPRVTVTFSFEATTCPCFVRYDEASGRALLADGIQAVSAGPDGCLRLWIPPREQWWSREVGLNQHDLDDDFDATTPPHSIPAFMFGRALNAKDVLKRPACFMGLGVSSALS